MKIVEKEIRDITSKKAKPDDDMFVSIPFIQLYDDDQYTYKAETNNGKTEIGEGWLEINKPDQK